MMIIMNPSTIPSPTSSSFAAALSHRINPSPETFSGDRAANPQWGKPETLELIAVRGELEIDFVASKRNKTLWEIVAGKMRDKGFVRTPAQCKCKWKNLLIRYKGKETSDPNSGRQCPFFEEHHAVLSERAKNSGKSSMDSQQVAVQSRKKMKNNFDDRFSDNFSQDGNSEVNYRYEANLMQHSNVQKSNAGLEKHVRSTVGDESNDPTKASFVSLSRDTSVMEMLKGFFRQQQMIDVQWRDSMERHQRERQLFEQERRQSMEKLERERLKSEQEWWEIEEQRYMRDKVRSKKRDTLLTTLLSQLIDDDHI